MRILLTGAAGYLGTACVGPLQHAGHEVCATDLREPALGTGDLLPASEWITADLNDPMAVEDLIHRARPDAIVHLAGLLDVAESRTDPAKYFRLNTAASFQLLHAATRAAVRRFVFASSNAVYGLPPSSPVSEDTPLCPRNPYAESKAAVDRALAWFPPDRHPACVALRFFNIAGGNEFSRLQGSWSGALSTRLLAAALGHIPQLDVLGTDYDTPDGTCQRDFLHVADAAQAVLAAVGCDAVGAVNIAGGMPVSILEAISAFRAATGRPIPWQDRGRRDGDVPVLLASIDRARSALGWQPRHSAIHVIAASAWESASQHLRSVSRTAPD